MARWDPGAEDRLKKAALELYGERGYDNVTVAQIAERAGLTRRSFFRYFADKREVLFAGSERLPSAMAEAVLDADRDASPLTAVLEATAVIGPQLVEDNDHFSERRAVIEASPELQERERTKLAAVTAAIVEALERRGADPETAKLVAQIAMVVFQNALEQWAAARGERDFTACLDAVAASLWRQQGTARS